MKDFMPPNRHQIAYEDGPQPDRTGSVRSISRHGFHNVAYSEWGNPENAEKTLCVHGLTRNGRDFDALANRLSENAHVVCPDLVGRGNSDWLSNAEDYNLLQYNIDVTVLLEKVGFKQCDWIGTSLGGLMGISLASLDNSPIRRLVINDVGPTIPQQAMRRILSYVGSGKTFQTFDEAEIHLRHTLSPFGPMTDDDWARMTFNSTKETENGLVMHNDPGIMQNFRRYGLFLYFSLWMQWERITCPVLILRGTQSDFLTENLLQRMTTRLPHADVIEFEGVGHTPTLNAPEQIEPVLEWLQSTGDFSSV